VVATRYTVDHRSLTDHDRLILKVLRLYYEHDLNQVEVARRMGFSRPKVSKLITEGRNRGLVKIEIAEPAGDAASLEIALEDRYGLVEALVVASDEDRQSTEFAAGAVGGALLARLCTAESSLGLSWGVSVRALAEAIPAMSFRCKKVVPLVGGMGKAEKRLHSNQVCADLAGKLNAEYLQLAAPAIARSARSRDELMEMPGITETLTEAASCDVAVAGIGGILPTSTMVEAGYFTLEEFLGLRARGAVGDICCHFLDEEGTPCLEDLSARILGLNLEQLKEMPRTVGIVTGEDKASGVAATLRGGYVNTLICDRDLAEGLLENEPQKEGTQA
jgi:DNA-binding transcriptional regulator LsrR (DeoR family)